MGLKILKLFKDFGLPEYWTETFPVELSYPTSQRNVSVTSDDGSTFYAVMVEPTVDDHTEFGELVVPTYHGYAPSGDVSGELVYVNYGSASDYAYLDGRVDLKGKIVIARYGHGFRGDKCALAQERGAVGCLIYSDPNDDGYLRGKTYPEGPWRPIDGVQRGSVWSGSGDPTTPGWPSTPASPRLNLTEASDAKNPLVSFPLPHIPTQPLSASDAKQFLSRLSGLAAPANMSGNSAEWLSSNAYHIGPGPAVAKIHITNDFSVKNISNHFARIPGSVEPDRLIIIGCHHDAWTYGGADPISGSVVLLEVAKAFGQMYKAGWRPRRTIIFASWDAEEYAVVGSAEWVELHYKELGARAVTYLNLDIAVSGTDAFAVEGTPQLASLMYNITKMVDLPASVTTSKSRSLYDLWAKASVDESGKPLVFPLGSGSDYSAFLQHAGITSMAMEFFGLKASGGSYPQYHSRYDTFFFMTKFMDPTWEYHKAVAKVLGLTAKSMADSFVLPLDFTTYSAYLNSGLKSLRAQLNSLGLVQFDWSSMEQSIENFRLAAIAARADSWKLDRAKNPDPLALRALNDRLFLTERGFLNYQGLPGQPWLRHMVYAPGRADSYTASMFPTIVNAASGGDPHEIQNQIQFVALFINSAAAVLSGGNGRL